MKNIIESLNWRYTTKKFDIGKKIGNKQLEEILEALRLSPSSYGLQPWKFILVNNIEVKGKIEEAAYGQKQITESSQVIVFTNKKNIDSNLVSEYINFVAKEKGMEVSNLEGFEKMINGSFTGKNNQELRSWAACQTYLAVGNLLTSCAVLGIDACPMEGFDHTKIDEILGLSDMNLESKVIVTIGYRSGEDTSASSKKIRFSKEDVFVEIN